jgi:hypothetical protein
MNKLDNIKNYNSDDFDSDEFDTDSELDSCDLEYDILSPSEINSKNCLTIANRNNRLKNKIKKYLHKNLFNLDENVFLKHKINILLERNYKLINLNNQIIKNYEYNMKIYKIISSFLTTSLFGVCFFYYKNIK